MQNKKIGIVGLGIMGSGMADNFLKNGHEVYVWNRTTQVAKDFEEKGVVVCSSPAQVAQQADLVFEVTANDESSREVWMGKDGILSGATSENILIASATLSISWIDELINQCQQDSLTFLDIPLTGGRVGAETGNLFLLCGGDEKVLEIIKPTLEVISAKIFHFGPVGHGMRYKLILNYIQAAHMISFGQAMKIAKSSGMDLEKVSEGLVDRPGGVITQIAKDAYFADPVPVTFSVEWITKDLTYAKKFAKDVDAKMLDIVLENYQKAMKEGFSDQDWAAVNKILEDK
jgi:3-hydroxyisobutyrate dehydrogenase